MFMIRLLKQNLKLQLKPLLVFLYAFGVLSIFMSVCTNVVASKMDLKMIYLQSLQHSPSLKAEYEQNKALQSQVGVMWGAFLPKVTVSASETASSVKLYGIYTHFQGKSANVNLSQILYDASAWQKYEASKNQSLASDATYQYQKQTFILQVTDAYLNVLEAQEDLQYVKANVKALKSAYDEASSKYKVGLLTLSNVQTAKAAYLNGKSGLLKAKNVLMVNEYTIKNLTGILYKDLLPLKVGVDKDFQLPVPNKIEYWLQLAMKNNHQLESTRNEIVSASHLVSAAQGAFYPQLSFQAFYGYSNNLGNMLSPLQSTESSNNWYMGLSFSWNVFNGGINKAVEEKNMYQYYSQIYTQKNQKRSLQVSVKTDYINLASIKREIVALESSVAASEDAYKQFKAKYQVGTATITQVLNQIKNLYAYKSQLAQEKYQWIRQWIQFKLDVGVLSDHDVDVLNEWLEVK